MIAAPSNPGFSLVNETRIAGVQPYFPAGDFRIGSEDRSRDFETIFAEFLSGLDRREEQEKIQGEAGAPSPGLRETGKPGESLGEAGSFREAEAPREPLLEAETTEEGAVSWEIAVEEAETGEDISGAPRPGGPPEEKYEESPEESRDSSQEFFPETSSGEFLLAGNFEAWRSGLQTRDGGGTADTETAEGGEEFSSGEPVDAGGEKISPQESLPVKNSLKNGPAVKNREGENGDESNSALSQKTLNPREEGLEGNFPIPEEPGGKPPELRAGEKAPPGLASSTEGGLRAFALSGRDERGEEKVPVLVSHQDRERKTEKPREDRGRRKVDLRDYREKPVPELPVNSHSFSKPSPESPGQFSARAGLEIPPELLSRDFTPADLSHGEAGSGGRVFEDTLARELRQNLNSDIVRHAQVILRDKGEGLIRLSLRPESLGNVKIRLELTENKIAGRIIVESGEALRAFEREIASLERSFREAGYESAELSAFLSQDGSGGGKEEGKPFYSPRFAQERARYDETWERTDTSFSGLSENGLGPGNGHIQVNMLI